MNRRGSGTPREWEPCSWAGKEQSWHSSPTVSHRPSLLLSAPSQTIKKMAIFKVDLSKGRCAFERQSEPEEQHLDGHPADLSHNSLLSLPREDNKTPTDSKSVMRD